MAQAKAVIFNTPGHSFQTLKERNMHKPGVIMIDISALSSYSDLIR